MRTNRIYVDLPLAPDRPLTLPPGPSRHLSKVLRLKGGASLVVFNGRGGEFGATVIRHSPRGVEIQVEDFRALERESPLELRLAAGIARGERMDFIIQKAVELGVSRIEALITEYTVVRLDPVRARRRLEHWRGVISHACEQCGRNRLPQVAPAARFADWLASENAGGLKLVLDPRSERRLAQVKPKTEPVTLLVGPEGGLSARELELAQAEGFHALSLGPRTLRTETAALAGLAAVQLQWGDLNAR